MGWIKDNATSISLQIRGVSYLKQECGVLFEEQEGATWVAEKCPLCGAKRTFFLRETPTRLGDWTCSACPATKSEHIANKGDLVDLVQLQEGLDKADAIRRILGKSAPHQIENLDPLNILRLTSQYFRFQLENQQSVKTYLASRKIKLNDLSEEFHVGGNAVTVDGLLDYLHGALSFPITRKRLRLNGLATNRGITFRPSVTAPLYDEAGVFVGLHFRHCEGIDQPFRNQGFDKKVKSRFLYGLHADSVKEAIAKERRVFVGKGVFDVWAVYQDGYHNVVGTMDNRMTKAQFDRLVQLGVTSLVLGFTVLKEAKIVAAMAKDVEIDGCPSVYSAVLDVDFSALNPEISFAEELDVLSEEIKADLEAQKTYRAREVYQRMTREFDKGKYFLMPKKEVQSAIKKGGPAPRLLVDLLERHRKLDNRSGQKKGYLKVPNSFVDDSLHRKSSAALRLLMHLHCKVSSRGRPVTIKNKTIQDALNRSETTIKNYKRHLIKLGLMIVSPPDDRHNSWRHHPLFICAKEDNT